MSDDESKMDIPDVYKAGEDLPGPMLRPHRIWTMGVVDRLDDSAAVAMILEPGGAVPNFDNTMTVLVPLDRVDAVIDLLRAAQKSTPQNRDRIS
jgi:hypothetical protein